MTTDTQFIGRFRVSDTLGIGGMGIVYAADDPDIGRKVAIKVLHTTGNPLDLERFKNEARTIGKMAHPNIVVLLEYGIDDNKPFLVMEYLPGEALDSWIEKTHKLSDHKDLLIDLCHALKYAHERDILHRDLKPGNVQVLPGGQAKLLDFGIAQARETGLTASGVVMGTPKYLAPEVLQNEVHTKSSDCYSLGLIAYTMLSGKNPFTADSFHAAVVQQLTLTPPPLHQLNSAVPKKLSAVIAKYLEKDPENRPETTALLEQTLKSIISDAELKREIVPTSKDSGSDDTSRTVVFHTRPEKSGTNKLLLAGIVSAVFIAIIASWLMFDDSRRVAPENGTSESMAKTTPLTPTPSEDIKPKAEDLKNDLRKEAYTLPTAIEKEFAISDAVDDAKDIIRDGEKDEIAATTESGSGKTQKNGPEDTAEPLIKEEIALIDPAPKKQKVEKKPVRPLPPVALKPEQKTVAAKKPRKKPVMTTAPVQRAPQREYTPRPIVVLPTFNLGTERIEITSTVELELSRGKTTKIMLDVPDNVDINEFKIYRAGKEIKQIKVRNIRYISNNKVQLNLYADNNTKLGAYSIHGIYKGKKTTPVTLKVTL